MRTRKDICDLKLHLFKPWDVLRDTEDKCREAEEKATEKKVAGVLDRAKRLETEGNLPQSLRASDDYVQKVLESARRFGETLSGMNAVVRGDTSTDQMSGKAKINPWLIGAGVTYRF